ncbi:MAG: M48 family metalloprotease [Acidobacteria bacterium]|nr:M48 family metalloprotease [Acidobacteriota bacterium]
MPLRLLLAALLAVSSLLAADKPPKDYTRNVGGGLNLFSENDELAMGQRYASELDARLSFISASDIQSFVESVARRLAASSLKPAQTLRVRVVNTREVNAFAVPGGFLYVNRGLIDLCENEGQLAGVIAHEIAHVEARHGTRQISKQLVLLGAIAGASALASRKNEQLGNVIAIAGGFGVLLANMKYSRDDEHQADALASRWMAAAGYPPGDLIGFFRKMDPSKAPNKAGRLLVLAGTHPPTADRIRNIEYFLPQIPIAASGRTQESFLLCKNTLAAQPAPPPGRDTSLGSALAAVGLAQASGGPPEAAPLGPREESQIILDLPGNTVWQAAKLSLSAGQPVEIWAEGEIFLRKDSDSPVDPSGMFASGRGFFKPIPSLNTGALLGRIVTDNVAGDPFPIGTHRVFRVPAAGRLELGINDDNNFDNRGSFRVFILTR